MSAALKWSKQIYVLRFVSVDMLIVIEKKVLFEDSTISMLNPVDLFLDSSRILHWFQTIAELPEMHPSVIRKQVQIIFEILKIDRTHFTGSAGYWPTCIRSSDLIGAWPPRTLRAPRARSQSKRSRHSSAQPISRALEAPPLAVLAPALAAPAWVAPWVCQVLSGGSSGRHHQHLRVRRLFNGLFDKG